MKLSNLVAPLAALFVLGSASIAGAQTVNLPIDTGYDYATFAPYAVGAQDNYWFCIAAYPACVPSVRAAFTLPNTPPWGPAMGTSRWIGPRNTVASAPGITINNPGYALFRKCFCLASNFNKAALSFRVMNDDPVSIWLNSLSNPLQTGGQSYSVPAQVVATSAQLHGLHGGRNCLYALVEDLGGYTGLDISGTFSANGLGTSAAIGPDQVQCPCVDGSSHPAGVANMQRMAAPGAAAEDQQIVDALVKLAETRRRSHAATVTK